MLTYFLLIISVFLILFIERSSKNKIVEKKKWSPGIYAVFLILVVFAGLRNNVGTDYMNYKNMFFMARYEVLFESNIEVLFLLICKTLSFFTDNYVYMFIVISIITIYILVKICFENTEYYELSIFLFLAFGFYTSTFNTSRQWISSLIGLYILINIQKFSFKKYMFLLTVAVLFHRSAFILIPSSLFVKYVIYNRGRIYLIISSIILYLIPLKLMEMLSFIIKNIPFLSKYEKYMKDVVIYNDTSFIIPVICILTYALFIIYKKNNGIIINNTYINILTLAFSFSLIGVKLMEFNRLQNFFLPIIVVIIPLIISFIPKREGVFIYILCIIMGLAFFAYTLYINGGNIVPYKSIFNIF